MAKFNNVPKDDSDSFDFVKLNFSDDKQRSEKSCTMRYKGVTFCMTKDNMDLIFEFVKRLNRVGSF